jgi:hypothetical protein
MKKGYPPMEKKLIKYLTEYYEGPNKELADLLGIDLACWNHARNTDSI